MPLLAGRYELLRTQETDSNSAAILGWDQRLKRWRSIRVARPGDEAAGDKLIAFAQRAAKLEHPNLERVIDVGRDGAVAFVVRDRFVCSLAQHLSRRGRIPAGWAARAVARCAEGLAWAHPRGIVHGHPRPEVVLFAEDGEAVLTHFGQRTTLRDDEETRLGAPWAHLAPELRQYWEPDIATDVFALGALLYTMVTGHHSAELFYAEAYEGMLSEVPKPLRPILLRACAFEPTERYDSAAELQEVLESKFNALPDVQEPPPWLEATQEFPDRGALSDPDAIIAEVAALLDPVAEGDSSKVSVDSQARTLESEESKPNPIPYTMPTPSAPVVPLGTISSEPELEYGFVTTGSPAEPRAGHPMVIGSTSGHSKPAPATAPPRPLEDSGARALTLMVAAFVAGMLLIALVGGLVYVSLQLESYTDQQFVEVVEAEAPSVSRWTLEDQELKVLWEQFRNAPDEARANAAADFVNAAVDRAERVPELIDPKVDRSLQRMSKARDSWQFTQ